MKYKTQRMLASAPPEYLERVARKAIPNLTEEQLAKVQKCNEFDCLGRHCSLQSGRSVDNANRSHEQLQRDYRQVMSQIGWSSSVRFLANRTVLGCQATPCDTVIFKGNPSHAQVQRLPLVKALLGR
jgi:hypothetical protein